MPSKAQPKHKQQQQQQQQQQSSESWEDFHQQYHSAQFRDSANNPSILRRIGQVPNSFNGNNNIRRGSTSSLVDQLLLMRQDSTLSMGSNSLSGSERSGSRSGRGNASFKKGGLGGGSRRRSQGNIKIGQPAKPKGGIMSWFRK